MSRPGLFAIVAAIAMLLYLPTLSHAAEANAPAITTSGHPELTSADAERWFDGYMQAAMGSSAVPGAVVVVVKDGRVLFGKGYGWADIARRRPVDSRTTLFRVGSISKLFTWTAVMQLADQKRLNLDTDVNRYLDFTIAPSGGRPVTLRQLMTHTAGFEDARRGTAVQNTEDLVALSRTMKRDLPPRVYLDGRTPAYSNYGTALAGYIVERISGERFERYVARHILGPLGMRHSSFDQPLPPALARDVAKGYMSARSPPGEFELINWSPAGGLSATGEDIARFMIAHLQDGALGNARILSTAAARRMHETPHVTIPGLQRMMLGFVERDVNGRDVIGHDGDTVLFHSMLTLYTGEHVGLFVSFNSPGVGGSALALREQLFADFSDRYFPGAPAAASIVSPAVARDHARLFAADYANSRSNSTSFMGAKKLLAPVRVLVDRDGSIAVNGLRATSGEPIRFRETSPFMWTEVGGHQRIAAVVENGRIVRFGIDLLAPNMVFDAIPVWKSPSWLRPAILLSVSSIALWLVAALGTWALRTRRGDQAVDPRAMLTMGAAFLVLASFGGWLWVFAQVLNPVESYLLAQHDVAILVIEGLTAFALPTLLVLAAIRIVTSVKAGTRRSVVSGVVLATSAVVLLHAAVAYDLTNFSLAS